jgi:hypothetical protein
MEALKGKVVCRWQIGIFLPSVIRVAIFFYLSPNLLMIPRFAPRRNVSALGARRASL